jgi:hypothetical protein
MPPTYQVTFDNRSSNVGSVCLYQTAPGFTALGGPYSLAWFAQRSAPSTQTIFAWEATFGFSWAETGFLTPGMTFRAAQELGADLAATNQITFGSTGGVFQLFNQRPGPQPGSLFVRQDQTVPPQRYSLGFTVDRQTAFAVPAQPNMTVVFKPDIRYWIIFGTFTQGEVLDTSSFAARVDSEFTSPAQLVFPPNVYALTAVLNADNTWTITPAE